MTAVDARTVGPARPKAVRRARPTPRISAYINRELSWLEFNARVLHEAQDPRNPLLERVKFLAIFASNLDEFFQVRVAGAAQQAPPARRASPDGRTAAEQLTADPRRVLELIAEHAAIWQDPARARRRGHRDPRLRRGPRAPRALRERFLDEIFPVLTPLAVDPGHPFPYISTLSLSIAVGLRDPETGENRFARVKVPPILPRLFEVEPTSSCSSTRSSRPTSTSSSGAWTSSSTHLFRVTRNADLAIEEDEADDLLLAIEEELRRRRFGEAVRLEVERSMPADRRGSSCSRDRPRRGGLLRGPGMLDLTGLGRSSTSTAPGPQGPALDPVIAAAPHAARRGRAGRRLRRDPGRRPARPPPVRELRGVGRAVHRQAADDPDVLTIKQTLYRTSGDSPIVRA